MGAADNGAQASLRGCDPSSPIGIFDSGIGGLSVLRHLRAILPHEHLLYFADSGFAPYGDKPEPVIAARSRAIAGFLAQHRIKALVVACNTATAAAIRSLREAYPALPVVGVEPGLKPAAALTATRVAGVLATEGTLASAKFHSLKEQIEAATGVRFLLQPCIGLADRIEKGELHSAATTALVHHYVAPLLAENADTLVLGCTHYPFVQPLIDNLIARLAGRPVAVVDTGEAVARQLARLLQHQDLTRTPEEGNGSLVGFTTGSESGLANAFSTLLKLRPAIHRIGSPEQDRAEFASAL
jgi:glutamate racemase